MFPATLAIIPGLDLAEQLLDPIQAPQPAGTAVRSMRAAVITGPGRVRIDDVAVPEPGSGEVRLRLEGCGVCASNLVPWSGPAWMAFPTAPGDLGHEGWGIVDAVGEGVADVLLGERVAALSYRAYAEYDIARADAVVPLPPALTGKPLPGEPLGCAINIFRRSEIAEGQTVAIVGAGFLGLILTRLASDAGARVIAISRRPFALEMARRMGAAEVLPLADNATVIGAVKELTDGLFCDRVVEAVGKQAPLDLAGELTRERGRLIIAGYHQDGPRQVNMWLWNWRGLDVVNGHERDPRIYIEGMRAGIAAVATGRLDLDELCTHSFPLERLGDALEATRARPEGFVKAVVRP